MTKTQIPAKGVAITHEDTNTIYFTVLANPSLDYTHEVVVEKDGEFTTVSISTIQKTDCWSVVIPLRYDIESEFLQNLDWAWKGIINSLYTRLKLTYNIWVDGHVRYESHVYLDKQTALNYGKTLTHIINKGNK